MPVPKELEFLRKFRHRHFEEPGKFESQDTSLPKKDKIVEWALLQIVEQLTAINIQLARMTGPKS